MSPRTLTAALTTLSADPYLGPLIEKYPKPTFIKGRDPFQALLRSIVYQQLSGKAAGTIHGRFVACFLNEAAILPGAVLALSVEDMRAAGLSMQKCTYIRDLALKFSDGSIDPAQLAKMPSDALVKYLTQVKGIGEWTVQMFLIFTLHRLDVLPTGDLGVQKGMKKVYRLKTLPDKKKMEKLAKPWRAYASIASCYFWKVADDSK